MEHNSRSTDELFQAGHQCLLVLMGQRYLVGILDLTPETVRISFPMSNLPMEGMLIQLEMHDESGYLSYEMEVLQGPRQVGDGLLLKRPLASQQIRHRGTWRVPTDFKAVLKDHVHPRRHQISVLNISVGGMLTRCSAHLKIGDNVDVSFSLPDEDVESPLLGEVMHVSEAPGPSEGDMLIGIRFVGLDTMSAQGILHYVMRRMRELYPAYSPFAPRHEPGR